MGKRIPPLRRMILAALLVITIAAFDARTNGPGWFGRAVSKSVFVPSPLHFGCRNKPWRGCLAGK